MTEPQITLPIPKPRRNYAYVGPYTWGVIRERYLAGESARVLSEEFGPSLACIRKRIWKEGWSKKKAALWADEALARAADQATLKEQEPTARPVAPAVPCPSASGPFDPHVAAIEAMQEALKLLKGGKPQSAAVAARAAESIARAAERLGGQTPDVIDAEAEFEAVRRKIMYLADDPEVAG